MSPDLYVCEVNGTGVDRGCCSLHLQGLIGMNFLLSEPSILKGTVLEPWFKGI